MEIDLNVLMLITLFGMLLAIFAGVHIALALGATAMIGTYFIFEDAYMAASQVGGAAYELIRDHVFMTIPLFVLMGDFLSRSGAAADLYNLINKGLRGVPGRLGVATVTGNTAFAAVTGTSIASAAAFTRIAWPEMKKAGYNHSFALGSISGSACLGMLIPPSVLLIVWGIITEDSIGKLFVAGVIPGILLALLYVAYNLIRAIQDPKLAPEPDTVGITTKLTKTEIYSGFSIIGLIFLVLGGIWGGFFTATEAAGMGAIASFVIALFKGMRFKGVVASIIDAGKALKFRCFVTHENTRDFPGLTNLIKELQSKETHLKISELINKDLSNSYVRVEVICDREGFWLKPHCDIKEKLMSCLLFVNKHNESEELGTDFYDSDLKLIKTLPYKDNYGYFFSSGPNTWHGMEKKEIIKERRCLQVNYVTFKTDWKVEN